MTSGVSAVDGTMPEVQIETIEDLISACIALGAENVPGWSTTEKEVANDATATNGCADADTLRAAIVAGNDPLGDAFCRLRSPEERRPHGQTYTPAPIVEAMLAWTHAQRAPDRVVDPGVGSARFLTAAGRHYPETALIGADTDPVATITARANLAVLGQADRARIELTDYRSLALPPIAGPTAYIGNPPYVRHHGITTAWKQWLTTTSALHGYKASQLAGLHVHFFLATLGHAQPGDYGTFVTSSEWLDVNYGSLVRQMLVDQLGGKSIHVVDPKAMPFSDATTTAAITCFDVGGPVESIRLQPVKALADLGALDGGLDVAKARLVEAPRWSPLLRAATKLPDGYVELGELARVHRGTVTGANKVWVRHRHEVKLPETVLRASITKARELFAAGETLSDASPLRVVIDLPTDLDELDPDERKAVERYLRRPEVKAAKKGYIASARRSWWSVGMREAAPILATYMARRPPAFVRNLADARHINVAHGIYPRDPISERAIGRLRDYLRVSVTLGQGRTYAGGLTKFEPREMERLPVPTPELLNDDSYATSVVEGTPGN